MYHLGKRIHHHRWLRNTALALLVIGLGAGATYRLLHTTTKPEVTIHNAPPVSTTYAEGNTAKIHVDKPSFTLDLPTGWQAFTPTTSTNIPSYSFRSPSVQARQLAVFIDNTPSSLAVNRVVTVSAKGDGLDHDSVSDNCTSFTRPSEAEQGSGIARGKWQGTDFLCDVGNYQRDVVGITSPEGVNVVTLTGATTGRHKVFMAYTDNNINPDFSVLYSILESFKLK